MFCKVSEVQKRAVDKVQCQCISCEIKGFASWKSWLKKAL